jgi:predicted membrane channel-forming protein YqfA (hemolysin III family)
VAEAEEPRRRFSFQGALSLVAAGLAVTVFLILVPATRWFFVISVVLGCGIAGILYLWHKFKPIKDKDVDHKRPLGL